MLQRFPWNPMIQRAFRSPEAGSGCRAKLFNLMRELVTFLPLNLGCHNPHVIPRVNG